MAYDAARRQVVLFGGYDGQDRNDTWTWDGRTWTEQDPATLPPPRSPVQLAYDAVNQEVLLWDYDTLEGGETWVWNGWDWTQRLPPVSPPYWDGYRMAYDGANREVLLFGGASCGDLGCNYNRETWTWNGIEWAREHPSRRLAGREAPGIVYDHDMGIVIMFGGCGGQGCVADTLSWDGTTWDRLYPSDSPSGRESMGIAYDVATKQVILFGGADPRLLGDTWVWDGVTWSCVQGCAL
jgi:hypothetical protein